MKALSDGQLPLEGVLAGSKTFRHNTERRQIEDLGCGEEPAEAGICAEPALIHALHGSQVD